MKYSATFLKYFDQLDHVGECDINSAEILSATVGERANHDVLQFSFALRGAKIIQARFKATGMPATFSAAEWVCCWLEGRLIMDVKKNLSPELILQSLDLNRHYIHIANLIFLGVMQCLQMN